MKNKKLKPSYSLTVYLLKETCSSFEDALDEERLSSFVSQPVNNRTMKYDSDSDDYRLYVKKPSSNKPDWAKLFDVEVNSRSASGLYLRRIKNRIMAIAFGPSGRHLIKESMIVRRFGLMVVLNSVDPGSLHSVDKVNLSEEGIQSRVQASRPSSESAFGIDIYKDLIRNVSGKSKDKDVFGTTIVGKDSLSVRIKVDLNSLDHFLGECLRAYESDAYKASFGFIDNIKNCDSQETGVLSQELVSSIISDDTNVKSWLSVPDIIDWADHAGFIYSVDKSKEIHDDLSFTDYIDMIDKRELSVDGLKKHKIARLSSDKSHTLDKWSIYRCLYAEMKHQGRLYILDNGEWYEVDKNFIEHIENEYKDIPKESTSLSFPAYKPKPDGKDKAETEGNYNKRLAAHLGGDLFDAVLIDLIGNSRFEFCDVYKDNKMIHVKRYDGSSALSHLFNQGYVSASSIRDGDVRKKINDKSIKGAVFGEAFSAGEYEIVYAIISKSNSGLDIPFFSKITLTNMCRDLRLMGYGVSLVKIEHENPTQNEGDITE